MLPSRHALLLLLENNSKRTEPFNLSRTLDMPYRSPSGNVAVAIPSVHSRAHIELRFRTARKELSGGFVTRAWSWVSYEVLTRVYQVNPAENKGLGPGLKTIVPEEVSKGLRQGFGSTFVDSSLWH